MLESGIKRIIRNRLVQEGFFILYLMATNQEGAPDTFVFKQKKKRMLCFMVEVKQPGETATPLQEYRHKQMKLYGMDTFVVTSWEELKEALLQKNYL